jgi:hypothetical protein
MREQGPTPNDLEGEFSFVLGGQGGQCETGLLALLFFAADEAAFPAERGNVQGEFAKVQQFEDRHDAGREVARGVTHTGAQG